MKREKLSEEFEPYRYMLGMTPSQATLASGMYIKVVEGGGMTLECCYNAIAVKLTDGVISEFVYLYPEDQKIV